MLVIAATAFGEILYLSNVFFTKSLSNCGDVLRLQPIPITTWRGIRLSVCINTLQLIKALMVNPYSKVVIGKLSVVLTLHSCLFISVNSVGIFPSILYYNQQKDPLQHHLK